MATIKIGDWTVLPSHNVIERDGVSVKLEPRAMDVLIYFSRSGGRVVSPEELLREVWHGRVFDDGVVYKKINQLRKALGDDSHNPRFIETIAKRGYRLLAAVEADIARAVAEPQGTIATTARLESLPAAAPAPAPKTQLARAVGFGAAAAAVAAVAWLVMLDPTPAVEERLEFAPLSFQRDGSEIFLNRASTVWSTDGRAIAFSALRTDRRDPPQVYVRYLESPLAIPLAPIPGGGLPKAWTALGRIVINTGRGVASGGLWTVAAVGGQPQPFFAFPERTTNVMSVSPDATSVAALRSHDGVWSLWTATLPDGPFEPYEPAPFATPGFINIPALSFSPDGRQLLLMLNPGIGGGEQAWLMPYPPDPARPPRRVLEALPRGFTPTFSWLPDNRHVVVSTAPFGQPLRLYLADTVSGRFRPLADAPSTTYQTAPVVSPDGSRLIFTEVQVDFDIVTLDVATAAVTPLIATNRIEQMPAWAADAGSLVYVADRDGSSEIWIRDSAGEDRPLVTERDFPPGSVSQFQAPQLSPDATRVIYGRVEIDPRSGATGAQLWMSALAGGAPMRLTDGLVSESAGSWSPDGEWYVYSEVPRDLVVSIKMAPTSGQAKPVTLIAEAANSGFLPVWSPDGRWILYDDDGLNLISVDGNLARAHGMKDTVCTFADVEPVLYCIRDIFGESTFVVADLNGTAQAVGPVAIDDRPAAYSGPGMRLSLTPDGRGVTYSVDRSFVQLLLVEGLATVALP